MTEVVEHLTYGRGRVAMAAILRALDIREGDMVAVQAYTCLAVPEGVMVLGAAPTYVDVRRGSVNMDPDRLESLLAGPSGSRVAAVVVQHTFGIAAPLDEILRVAEKYCVPVVEDCCHTFLSQSGGRRVGTLGAAAFYSYEWGKPRVCGVGGSAVAVRPDLRELLLEQHAQCVRPRTIAIIKGEIAYFGFRLAYRPRLYWTVRQIFRFLSEQRMIPGSFASSSAILERQARLGFMVEASPLVRRRIIRGQAGTASLANTSLKLTNTYRRMISTHSHVGVVDVAELPTSVMTRFPLAVADKAGFMSAARRQRVEVAGWYESPVHPWQGENLRLVGYSPGQCVEAERRALEVVSLPLNGRVGRPYLRRLEQLLATTAPAAVTAPRPRSADGRSNVVEVGPFATDDDARQMAQLHIECISDGFLSALGAEFLTEVYRGLAASPRTFVFASTDATGRLTGLICGGLDTGPMVRSFALRHPWKLARSILRSGSVRRMAARALESARFAKRGAFPGLPTAQILNFCVAPDVRGTAVAYRLFRRLEARFSLLGVSELTIVTGEDQVRAQRFYERCGAVEAGRLSVHSGSTSVAYRYSLPTSGAN